MAFGISRDELRSWKAAVSRGEIAFLTHYWIDDRFPGMRTVTKVGCSDPEKLASWCISNGLDPRYIHHRSEYPHFDLFGSRQYAILKETGQQEVLRRFGIGDCKEASR